MWSSGWLLLSSEPEVTEGITRILIETAELKNPDFFQYGQAPERLNPTFPIMQYLSIDLPYRMPQ